MKFDAALLRDWEAFLALAGEVHMEASNPALCPLATFLNESTGRWALVSSGTADVGDQHLELPKVLRDFVATVDSHVGIITRQEARDIWYACQGWQAKEAA